MTADPFKPKPNYNRNVQQAQPQLNPQTTEFCAKLGIDDPLEKLIGKPIILTAPVVNPDEISLDDDDEDQEEKDEQIPGEGGDFFFVDTKPQKRNKMNLPQPQQQIDEGSLLGVEKVHTVDATVEENTSEVQGNEDDQEIPCVKKFKRRNRDLYTEQDQM